MKAKEKICSNCGESRVIWKNYEGEKYCKYCWGATKAAMDAGKPLKPRAKIKPKSAKQSKLDIIYSQLRKIFLTDHPVCQANLAGCTHEATDVHHKKGRGKWYLVIKTWMPLCRSCHKWIEEHPIEATELGYRESKITD